MNTFQVIIKFEAFKFDREFVYFHYFCQQFLGMVNICSRGGNGNANIFLENLPKPSVQKRYY